MTSEGRKAADLNIDLEKKVMARGLGSFDIVQEEGNYITAYQRIMSGGIGGEVFVLDRNTGEYQRGVVGVYYTEDTINKPNEKGSFGAWVYSGRCTKPQL
ncbi:hypothetical protein BOW46_03425 [Solemya velum gill symbiont]|nr:hypothetical protein BOW38_04275 [Solemya velum gill symbiont]OOZ52144.1 hypothetical protein BOW40_03600 [Solemya velum gill symbiont]OOZ54991.1 hypothetical protein BOW41_04785 [Solemya velum gill symbiont]OOZ67408.1 hypothetical protein BOW46_03425 [Solemya velum gill symbiont]OOZ69475.1 hypothetical protein BOW47_04755 [Solemya velum gill symbiont]